MKKINPVLTLSFCFAAMIFSCRKEEIKPAAQPQPIQEPAPAPPAESFTYIRKGNRWVYDMVLNGTVVDSLTREITDVDSAGTYRSVLKDSHSALIEYYFKQDGKLMYYPQGGSRSKAVVFMYKAVSVNDQWIKWDGKDSLQVIVKETGKEIGPYAGEKYVCAGIEEKNHRTGQLVYYYTNPGYGMIQMQITYSGQAVIYRLRNKNF